MVQLAQMTKDVSLPQQCHDKFINKTKEGNALLHTKKGEYYAIGTRVQTNKQWANKHKKLLKRTGVITQIRNDMDKYSVLWDDHPEEEIEIQWYFLKKIDFLQCDIEENQFITCQSIDVINKDIDRFNNLFCNNNEEAKVTESVDAHLSLLNL